MATETAQVLSNEEQVRLMLARSAENMTATDFWQLLMKVLAAHESNALVELFNYFKDQAHPDREEVMTLCLKWYALRSQRKLMLENVRDFIDYKKELKDQVYRQYAINPDLAVPEESEI